MYTDAVLKITSILKELGSKNKPTFVTKYVIISWKLFDSIIDMIRQTRKFLILAIYGDNDCVE